MEHRQGQAAAVACSESKSMSLGPEGTWTGQVVGGIRKTPCNILRLGSMWLEPGHAELGTRWCARQPLGEFIARALWRLPSPTMST